MLGSGGLAVWKPRSFWITSWSLTQSLQILQRFTDIDLSIIIYICIYIVLHGCFCEYLFILLNFLFTINTYRVLYSWRILCCHFLWR